jgi:hypothetical protein
MGCRNEKKKWGQKGIKYTYERWGYARGTEFERWGIHKEQG